jgi:hypothetical protein
VTKEQREKKKRLKDIFRNYKENKKALRDDYNFPSLSAVDFSRIAVQTDKSRNIQEDKIIDYADKKTALYAQVFIVEEVLRWFEVEGHGRERFIKVYVIDGSSWNKAMRECHISSPTTLASWLRDALEKADWYAKWLRYY